MRTAATALISRAGRAVVRDGEAFYVLTVDDPGPRPADGTHWMHLRALHPDCEVLSAGEHPFPTVQARLREVWREQLGLDLLLICMDRDHDDDFRRETCAVLEKMLGEEPWLRERLRGIALSVETPAEADLAGAKALAIAANAVSVAELLGEVLLAGEAISVVRGAWRGAIETLATPAERTEATDVAQRLRAVAKAVIALRRSAPEALGELRTWCQSKLQPLLTPVTTDAAGLVERWLAAIEKGRAPESDSPLVSSHIHPSPHSVPESSTLGSAALEAYREARRTGGASEDRRALLRSIESLIERLRLSIWGDVEPELGSMLGILASYGVAEATEAVEKLRQVGVTARNRVLPALKREYQARAGNLGGLADAILLVCGGIGDTRLARNRPTPEEQRWAAETVRTFGSLTPEQEAHADRLVVPESIAAKKKIKAPSWTSTLRSLNA